MGFDWPLSPVWLALGALVFLFALFFTDGACLRQPFPGLPGN